MNNPSPLVPQGATPPRAKSSLYVKILMILSVHVVVIGGMLLQGCQDTKKDAKTDTANPATNDAMAANPNTIPAPTPAPVQTDVNASNAYAATTPATAVAPAPMPATQPVTPLVSKPTAAELATPAAPGEAKEYVIVKGDMLATIARKNSVSLKALMDANPGVNPKKLQVGQKVQIPGGAAAVAATTSAAPGAAMAEAAPSDGSTYVVKSGDTLSKIAKTHGTTFKKIMAMNDLKTTSIHAGQKLKVPAGKSATSEPVAAPTTGPASASVIPTPAPSRVVYSTSPASAPASSVAAN